MLDHVLFIFHILVDQYWSVFAIMNIYGVYVNWTSIDMLDDVLFIFHIMLDQYWSVFSIMNKFADF